MKLNRGDVKMLKMLLRAGADPSIRTKMDMTPGDVVNEWVLPDNDRAMVIRNLLSNVPLEISYVGTYLILQHLYTTLKY